MRGIRRAADLYQRNEAPVADTNTHTLSCSVSTHGFMLPVTSHLFIRLLEYNLITSSISAGTEAV